MAGQDTWIELYKTTLDYRAKVISIIFASGIAIAIPNIVAFVDNYNKAANESSKAGVERDRIKEEIALKKEELKLKQQEYIAKFVDKAIDDDIELRIRFAEYFTAISDDPTIRWVTFLKILTDRRDDLYAKLDDIVGKLAVEQGKDPRNDAQIALHLNQINRIQKQVGTLKLEYAKGNARLPTVEGELPNARPVAISRLLEVFGQPAKNIGDKCGGVDSEALRSQLRNEGVGLFSVTMLGPAVESLRYILSEMEKSEPELWKRLSTLGSICVRYVRGSATSLSNHSFGTAIDISIDRKIIPLGTTGTGELEQSIRRVAEYFERAGWVWGGKFQIPDPMHFEVGSELFERWVSTGALKPTQARNGG